MNVSFEDVKSFLTLKAANYMDGYECDDYNIEGLLGSLEDFLVNRKEWKIFKDAYNEERCMRIADIRHGIEELRMWVASEVSASQESKMRYTKQLLAYEEALRGGKF